ncbi:hypothetical protein BS50DRAFT_106487 [Corynespora cassiicola Philippines]|uniref:Uncharacterized protein n=1 Tax=Corynespora cassiicola Philippines TaxID=1448308 RepID=A0A2T2ND78_CORCC|nr:hypothetical protein BS50DRAFT_106487 [Corynespora cassiicola Philippines]
MEENKRAAQHDGVVCDKNTAKGVSVSLSQERARPPSRPCSSNRGAERHKAIANRNPRAGRPLPAAPSPQPRRLDSRGAASLPTRQPVPASQSQPWRRPAPLPARCQTNVVTRAKALSGAASQRSWKPWQSIVVYI